MKNWKLHLAIAFGAVLSAYSGAGATNRDAEVTLVATKTAEVLGFGARPSIDSNGAVAFYVERFSGP